MGNVISNIVLFFFMLATSVLHISQERNPLVVSVMTSSIQGAALFGEKPTPLPAESSKDNILIPKS